MPNLGYRVATQVVHRIPLRAGKLGRSLDGRRGAAQRWTAWAARARPTHPVVWVHAASVGEAHAAAPVIARIRGAYRNGTVILTASSPALAGWPDTFGTQACDFVPVDAPATVRQTLDALKPDLLVFSRGDLWPELVAQAHDRGIPIAVIGAVVRPTSRKLGWASRRFFTATGRRVDWLGAVSEADAARWQALGIPADAIIITGDPRHDAVIERTTRLHPIRSLAHWAEGHPVLVAGSVEQSDEPALLAALSRLCQLRNETRVLLVPHGTERAELERLYRGLLEAGIQASVWTTDTTSPTTRCVIVGALGLLFDLYVLADIAYVGGGFRPRGLHGVIEPAAYGVPVVFGPHWSEFADARALIASGGAIALPARAPVPMLVDTCERWFAQGFARTEAGLAARRVLQEGAADRTAAALLALTAKAQEQLEHF